MAIEKLKVMLSFMRELTTVIFPNRQIMVSATLCYGISLRRVRMKV